MNYFFFLIAFSKCCKNALETTNERLIHENESLNNLNFEKKQKTTYNGYSLNLVNTNDNLTYNILIKDKVDNDSSQFESNRNKSINNRSLARIHVKPNEISVLFDELKETHDFERNEINCFRAELFEAIIDRFKENLLQKTEVNYKTGENFTYNKSDLVYVFSVDSSKLKHSEMLFVLETYKKFAVLAVQAYIQEKSINYFNISILSYNESDLIFFISITKNSSFTSIKKEKIKKILNSPKIKIEKPSLKFSKQTIAKLDKIIEDEEKNVFKIYDIIENNTTDNSDRINSRFKTLLDINLNVGIGKLQNKNLDTNNDLNQNLVNNNHSNFSNDFDNYSNNISFLNRTSLSLSSSKSNISEGYYSADDDLFMENLEQDNNKDLNQNKNKDLHHDNNKDLNLDDTKYLCQENEKDLSQFLTTEYTDEKDLNHDEVFFRNDEITINENIDDESEIKILNRNDLFNFNKQDDSIILENKKKAFKSKIPVFVKNPNQKIVNKTYNKMSSKESHAKITDEKDLIKREKQIINTKLQTKVVPKPIKNEKKIIDEKKNISLYNKENSKNTKSQSINTDFTNTANNNVKKIFKNSPKQEINKPVETKNPKTTKYGFEMQTGRNSKPTCLLREFRQKNYLKDEEKTKFITPEQEEALKNKKRNEGSINVKEILMQSVDIEPLIQQSVDQKEKIKLDVEDHAIDRFLGEKKQNETEKKYSSDLNEKNFENDIDKIYQMCEEIKFENNLNKSKKTTMKNENENLLNNDTKKLKDSSKNAFDIDYSALFRENRKIAEENKKKAFSESQSQNEIKIQPSIFEENLRNFENIEKEERKICKDFLQELKMEDKNSFLISERKNLIKEIRKFIALNYNDEDKKNIKSKLNVFLIAKMVEQKLKKEQDLTIYKENAKKKDGERKEKRIQLLNEMKEDIIKQRKALKLK